MELSTWRGRRVSVGGTRLYIREPVGTGIDRKHPILLLHGLPGDHHMFADYLEGLARWFRPIYIDLRHHGRSDPCAAATWTIEWMASDISKLATALGLRRYTVFGHSFGGNVALQHAVSFPGDAAHTVVSGAVPSADYLAQAHADVAALTPTELRLQIRSALDREATAQTPEDVKALVRDEMPWNFSNMRDPRIETYLAKTRTSIYRPDILRHLAKRSDGGIDVEPDLDTIRQPILVLAGRDDRNCPVEASEVIANRCRHAKLIIFEQCGHMMFVEQPEAYVGAIKMFLTDQLETDN